MSQGGLTTGAFQTSEVIYHEFSFSKQEYRDRQNNLRALMKRNNIDLVYITNPDLICYLHGFRAGWYKANSPIRYPINPAP